MALSEEAKAARRAYYRKRYDGMSEEEHRAFLDKRAAYMKAYVAKMSPEQKEKFRQMHRKAEQRYWERRGEELKRKEEE